MFPLSEFYTCVMPALESSACLDSTSHREKLPRATGDRSASITAEVASRFFGEIGLNIIRNFQWPPAQCF